ncbi:baeRF2 domain-containing protein [Hamadaea tsunoensis]|uniref:baeRF2 domain-containing protein n=1 Tax=Hamadaea tsunoensis TaxID=53368 RepID=UPI00041DB4B5|nr:hypothetical protein [Hamadaea tsunoensis]
MNIAFLRPLFERTGAWASVYPDDARDAANARHEVGPRWQEARRQLAAAGAPAGTIDAAATLLDASADQPGAHGLAAFAAERGATATYWMPEPSPVTLARYGPSPFVLPLLRGRRKQVSWLRVVVDRTGTTIEYASAGAMPRRDDVQGAGQYPVREVDPADWPQARVPDETEPAWQGDAAEAVARYAEAIGADVVVIAGDVTARRLLQNRLPVRWQLESVLADPDPADTSPADTGLADTGSAAGPALDGATARIVGEIADARDNRVLDRFHETGTVWAVRGREATELALHRAQVDTLLLAAHAPDDQANDPVRNDLVRAAALTQADVLFLEDDRPEDLRDGIGALLRYADPETAH